MPSTPRLRSLGLTATPARSAGVTAIVIATLLALSSSPLQAVASNAADQPLRSFDIRDFGGDIQAVMDHISEGFPAGGIVHIPKGRWQQSGTLVIKGGRVIIEGEGQDTRVVGKDKDTHVFQIVPQAGLTSHAYDITFRDLMIEGNSAGAAGDGDGIHWAAPAGDRATALHMDHVAVNGCGRDGLHLEHVDFPVILDCSFSTNGRDGAHLFSVAQSLLLGYYAGGNRRWGLYCEEAGGHFVQANGIEANHSLTGAAATDGQLKFKNCGGVIVRSQFEDFTRAGAKTAIDLEGARGVVVEGCGFTTGRPPHTAVGIRIRGACKAVSIGANAFNNCGVCVDASDSSSSGVSIAPQDDNGGNLVMVSYPTGAAADGWQGLLALVQDPGAPESMKIPGIRIPFRAAPYRGPAPGPDNEGTLVYDRTADRGNRLLLSDGSHWWPVGGVPGGFALGPPDTRPAGVAPGTTIWVPDAPIGHQLQTWDGNGWQRVPVGQVTRRLWLPISTWTQIEGTGLTLSGKGAYPNTAVCFSFVDAPASGPQAIGITVGIPEDYVSGTPASASVVWAPGADAPAANRTWVGRLHYSRITDGTRYDAAEAGVASQAFGYWGGGGAGGSQPSGPRAVVTQPWTDVVPSASLAAGGVLRLAFDRFSTDAKDDFPQDVEVLGIVLEYTAER